MPDISQINLPGDNNTYNIADVIARGRIWQGTQAQYNALTTIDPDTVYFITDAAGTVLATVATTGSYNDLTDKPQVNGITLSGDKDSEDLGIVWQGTQAQYDLILTKDPNTMYFITDAPIVACDADEITYDNTTSGLSATDAQSAIDELSSEKMEKSNPVGTGSLSLNRSGATGTESVSIGHNCVASGVYSYAEGMGTTSSGNTSHAEGYQTTSSGYYSHAEGWKTTASGTESHAEGDATQATGDYSHSEGMGTIAQRRSQHVFGEFNEADTGGTAVTTKGNYIEIVGKGANTNSRSNARTLDWNGNEVLAGGLKVNGSQNVSTGVSENLLTTSTTGVQNIPSGKNISDYCYILICLESGYILYDVSLIPTNLFKSGFSLLVSADSSNYSRITYSSETAINVNALSGSYKLRVYGVK